VFDALVAREKLGSTGIGEGIAIPHCRLGHCEGAVGLLLKLEDAVDFDAVDGRPVDLVFVLLVPEQNPEQHLKTLSHLASLFNDDDYRSDLRRAHSNQQLFQVAVESEAELRLAS
jgi:nitrogen PTS system EIIA component